MARKSKQHRFHRWLLFAACLGGTAGYAWCAVNAYWAQRLADRPDQVSIRRAVALAPQDATYHDLLCRSMMFSSQDRQAVEECGKASELNGYSSTIWLDLAQSYYSTGNAELSTAAIRKALTVDPTTPDTAWSAANFLLIQGNTPEALKEFAVVLRQEPSLVAPALNICWQSLHDVHLIQAILPPNPEVYLAFVKLLLSTGEFDSAHQVWSALVQLKSVADYHDYLFYIDSLLRAGAVTQASGAWQQLASGSMELKAYLQQNNLVMDGSFSHEILNSGFGWRYSPKPQVYAALDRGEFHSGDRSLRLIYSGSGSDAGIFQYVAVNPNTRYRLSAWVKSDDLETANGPALTMMDGYGNDIFGSTEETTGTTAWHRVETELTTRADTKLLILAILRRPGTTRIQGKFWVDDAALTPLRSD